MKKTHFFSLLLTLALALGLLSPAALAASTDEMHILGTAALLVDADHDEVLFSQNGYDKRYPASITKVMTGLLVIEAINRGELSADQVITASSTFSQGLSIYGSSQNIKAGEQMTVKDLLYCMLVASANEACNILAEAVAGSQSAFVERMNQRAAELGCTGTHFVNAHGLHDDNHYTTAYDIYLMVREGMKHELFRTITSTDEYWVPATNLSEQRHFFSTNYLLSAKKIPGYTYSKATGVKTGSTDEAGHCLVSAAEDGDRHLIAVVMGAENIMENGLVTERQVFTESKRLLEWGFSNFSRQTLLTAGMPVQEVAVTLSKEAEYVMVVPAQGLEATLPNDLSPDQFRQSISLPDSVVAPVEEGQVLGTLTLSYDGEEYGTVDLVARNSVALSTWLYRQQQLDQLFSHWWVKLLLVVVLAAMVILLLRLTLFRRNRRYGSSSAGRSRMRSYRGGRRRR